MSLAAPPGKPITKTIAVYSRKQEPVVVSDRIRSLPKAELHVHIEGTLEPELAVHLAYRNGIELPYESVEALRDRYEFDDLQSFLNLYYECMSVLRTRRDFTELAAAYLERARKDGVRHVEMFFDPQVHANNGVPVEDVIDGLKAALDEAENRFGMTGGLIMCFLRDEPVASAYAVLEAASSRIDDLIGVGLDSAEVGYPPNLFAEVFAKAKSLGLHVVAHAGEEGPAGYVAQALDLGVERIDHGIRALEDPAVVARLHDESIPLTVCPLSNVRLRAVSEMSHHPLPALISAGLIVTINSDDPAYFGGYIAENFAAIKDAFDLDDNVIAQLARNSVLGSFAGDRRKRALLEEISSWLEYA